MMAQNGDNLIMRIKSLICLLPLLLCSCSPEESTSISFTSQTSYTQGETVAIHTEVQHVYIAGPVEKANLYARGVEELSRPLNITYEWSGGEAPFKVYLSEKEDYAKSKVYECTEAKVSITNLKIATKYYLKVTSGEETVKTDSFTTSDEVVRNLYVSGITNVRDLGGYPLGNVRTNQGLIFRTGRLNNNSVETPTAMINEKGVNVMLNDLGVRSEIDLRMVSNNEVGGLTEGVGILGESVHYYQCPMDYNVAAMGGDFNDASLRKVFSILGNRDNYPTFFHCSIGTDRTGYVAWLINGYLGLNEEYLWRDYLFSNFGNIGSKREQGTIRNSYIKLIRECPGSTWQEKTKTFLLTKGVAQSDLDVLSSMMIPQ